MEFKVMDEEYKSNYPTEENNKNDLWLLMFGCKKISVGMICLCLIINKCFGLSFDNFVPVESSEPLGSSLAGVVTTSLGIIPSIIKSIVLIGVIVFIIIEIKKYINKKVVKKKGEKKE